MALHSRDCITPKGHVSIRHVAETPVQVCCMYSHKRLHHVASQWDAAVSRNAVVPPATARGARFIALISGPASAVEAPQQCLPRTAAVIAVLVFPGARGALLMRDMAVNCNGSCAWKCRMIAWCVHRCTKNRRSRVWCHFSGRIRKHKQPSLSTLRIFRNRLQ